MVPTNDIERDTVALTLAFLRQDYDAAAFLFDQYANSDDMFRLIGGLCTMNITGAEALLSATHTPVSVEDALVNVAINLAKAQYLLGGGPADED